MIRKNSLVAIICFIVTLLLQANLIAEKKKKEPIQKAKPQVAAKPAQDVKQDEPKKASIASPLGNFQKTDDPTYIESASLTLRSQDRTFTYTGGVKVTRGDLTLTAQELEGNYTEENEIKILTAKKNVVIIKGDSIRATGEKAVYDAATAIVTLTENPQVTQGESQLLADVIKIFVNEDRSEAEGNVRMKVVKQPATPAPAKP